jgi:transcriptional regulator with XRE-family HTH domain
MAYRFMKTNQDRYTIKEMAGVLGVSRSAYYRWARNGVSQRRAEADAELLNLIRQIVEKRHLRYGRARVRAERPCNFFCVNGSS